MAGYHTHPVKPHSDQAEFSVQDKETAGSFDKLPGYLAGADAEGVVKILRFTPRKGTLNGVTEQLGIIDENGSFIPRWGEYYWDFVPHTPRY